MQYLLLAVVLVLALVVFGSCRRQSGAVRTDPAPAAAAADTPAGPGSRAEMLERLRVLAKTPVPSDLSPGAMCYEAVAPPDRAEYVCPECGEKTLYARGPGDDDAGSVADSIPACRRWLEGIGGLDARLDEASFCSACRPGEDAPSLALVVRYPDGREHRAEGVTALDLMLLSEFLSGATKHDAGMSGEQPLKDWIPRLEELLGVSLEDDD